MNKAGFAGGLSASSKIHMVSLAPKGKQLKQDRDSVIQAVGKKEACSPHNFPASHVLRTQPGVKHRMPKPFPKELHSRWMRGAHSVPRARAGVHRCMVGSAQRPKAMGTQWELFSWEHKRTSKLILQRKWEDIRLKPLHQLPTRSGYWGKLTPNAS